MGKKTEPKRPDYYYDREDIVAPSGWRIVDYRVPGKGETFLMTSKGREVATAREDWPPSPRYIVERI